MTSTSYLQLLTARIIRLAPSTSTTLMDAESTYLHEFSSFTETTPLCWGPETKASNDSATQTKLYQVREEDQLEPQMGVVLLSSELLLLQ